MSVWWFRNDHGDVGQIVMRQPAEQSIAAGYAKQIFAYSKIPKSLENMEFRIDKIHEQISEKARRVQKLKTLDRAIEQRARATYRETVHCCREKVT